MLELDGHEVTITNPGKIFFPALGKTKLDVVNYCLSVADGALRGVRDRPMNLKRFPNGAESDPFYQKRAPTPRPPWIRSATVHFPSGRSADEVMCSDSASLAWLVNLGCIDLNPWAARGDLRTTPRASSNPFAPSQVGAEAPEALYSRAAMKLTTHSAFTFSNST